MPQGSLEYASLDSKVRVLKNERELAIALNRYMQSDYITKRLNKLPKKDTIYLNLMDSSLIYTPYGEKPQYTKSGKNDIFTLKFPHNTKAPDKKLIDAWIFSLEKALLKK